MSSKIKTKIDSILGAPGPNVEWRRLRVLGAALALSHAVTACSFATVSRTRTDGLGKPIAPCTATAWAPTTELIGLAPALGGAAAGMIVTGATMETRISERSKKTPFFVAGGIAAAAAVVSAISGMWGGLQVEDCLAAQHNDSLPDETLRQRMGITEETSDGN